MTVMSTNRPMFHEHLHKGDGRNHFQTKTKSTQCSKSMGCLQGGASCDQPLAKRQKMTSDDQNPEVHRFTNQDQRRQQLKAERHRLPIRQERKRLLQHFCRSSNGSVVILGETGCGKTTQVPQYIYQAGLNKGGIIACTQPRRVAAITIAQRVAEEMASQLGNLVGYNVRFDDCTSSSSKIIYMTDGMLLREALLDPLLSRYSFVILDEAHERTINNDVLFGVVKSAQKKRLLKCLSMLPLQVVVMSATIDVDHFSRYFNNAPVFFIVGREHPVEVLCAKQSQPDYVMSCVNTVFQVHQEAPPNEDILVFLTGQDEIESAVKSVRIISRDLPSDCPPLLVYPLYAALPPSEQLKVFGPTPQGTRKIIFATNIAETSVTIHGIKHVVDCGRVKTKCFNASRGLDLMSVQWVSKAQAWQRTGRAGREGPGICYRIFTQDENDSLAENTIPEIKRCNLASVALQLLAMGIKDIADFDFMDKPMPESVHAALDQLLWLDAIDSTTSPKLTPVGKQLVAFPLSPQLSKVLLAASKVQCLDEVISIVSMLSVDSVLHTPHSKQEEALSVRRKFIASEGDHLTLLNIFTAYTSAKQNKKWCNENYLNPRNLKLVSEVRNQLKSICESLHLPVNAVSCQDTAAIRKSLCAGFFMNAAEHKQDGIYVTVYSRKQVHIHPSSVLFLSRPKTVIYNELVQTNKCYMRDLTLADAEWLYDAAPPSFRTMFARF